VLGKHDRALLTQFGRRSIGQDSRIDRQPFSLKSRIEKSLQNFTIALVFPTLSTGIPQVFKSFSTPFPHQNESFPQGIELEVAFFGELWISDRDRASLTETGVIL
jgi:hypothetical protein